VLAVNGDIFVCLCVEEGEGGSWDARTVWGKWLSWKQKDWMD